MDKPVHVHVVSPGQFGFFHSVDGLFQDLSTCPDSRCQINFLKVTAGKERQAKKEAEK